MFEVSFFEKGVDIIVIIKATPQKEAAMEKKHL